MSYEDDFFAENVRVTLPNARIMLPQVLEDTAAKRVVDVGCGTATWASVAKERGCKVLGVDGYVTATHLLIDPDEFEQLDLSHGYNCSGYDLAISLEFAEHLPTTSAEPLVAGLCQAPFVLFSAAHPGQGGLHHINERWSSYWADIFAQYGYVGSCDIRDRHWNDDSLELYYRENILLFSTPERLADIGYSQSIRDEVHPRRP